jgi:hypothetical protein
MVEDRGVRREPRDRKRLDVSFERAGRQQIAGNVVERQALTHIMQRLGAFMSELQDSRFGPNVPRSTMTRKRSVRLFGIQASV